MTSPSAPDSGTNDNGYFHSAFNQDAGVSAFGQFIRPSDGEVIITEGEPQDALYLVLSGTLQVSTSAEGHQLPLATLGEGDSLGEVNLFDPATASANVTSQGDSVIWRIRHDELDHLLEADPQAGCALMKGLVGQLSARIRVMNQKLVAAELEGRNWNPTIS